MSECVSFLKKNGKIATIGAAIVAVAAVGIYYLNAPRTDQQSGDRPSSLGKTSEDQRSENRLSSYDNINKFPLIGGNSPEKFNTFIGKMEQQIEDPIQRIVFLEKLEEQAQVLKERYPEGYNPIPYLDSVLPSGRFPGNLEEAFNHSIHEHKE